MLGHDAADAVLGPRCMAAAGLYRPPFVGASCAAAASGGRSTVAVARQPACSCHVLPPLSLHVPLPSGLISPGATAFLGGCIAVSSSSGSPTSLLVRVPACIPQHEPPEGGGRTAGLGPGGRREGAIKLVVNLLWLQERPHVPYADGARPSGGAVCETP
jgi:hypothetical protein